MERRVAYKDQQRGPDLNASLHPVRYVAVSHGESLKGKRPIPEYELL